MQVLFRNSDMELPLLLASGRLFLAKVYRAMPHVWFISKSWLVLSIVIPFFLGQKGNNTVNVYDADLDLLENLNY